VTAEKVRRAYEANVRSAWEHDYAGAIEAAQSGDAARLVDLLRAERTPTGNDFQRLADYVERLHREPGRTEDPTVYNNALVADAIFDHFRLDGPVYRIRSGNGFTITSAASIRRWSIIPRGSTMSTPRSLAPSRSFLSASERGATSRQGVATRNSGNPSLKYEI